MLLEVNHLTKDFGGLRAINDLSLYVPEHEILGIIGPNGAGKSTLFNLLSGFLPLTGGTILFQGKIINGLQNHRIARMGIGRTFQTTRIFSNETVLNNIWVGLIPRTKHGVWNALFRRRKRDEKRLLERCKEVLRLVDLEERAERIAGELDQEAQKRLSIGIALATNPKLLLLDEPTGGINTDEINHLMDIIRRIWESGITICLIEHKLKMVMELCERIVVLNYGKKIAEGTPREITTNPEAISAYLGKEEDAS